MQHPQHVVLHLTDFQKTSIRGSKVSVCNNVGLDLIVLITNMLNLNGFSNSKA